MEAVPDWSDLPLDLLAQIASCVAIMEDFMTFRGVCTAWCSAATKDRFVTVSKLPLLMLAKKHDSDEREFYSLSKRKICTRIPLPEAKGKRCINVGFGWMVELASSDEDFLLKPFSAARIQLPNFTAFPEDEYSYTIYPKSDSIERVVLTADPSETSNFTVVMVCNYKCGFWRNGDEKWTTMNHKGIAMAYCIKRGKLYTLDFTSHVCIWDPHGTNHLRQPLGKVKVDNVSGWSTMFDHYLVESTDGELLIITQYNASNCTNLVVKRVDLVRGECEEIIDVGKDAIFIGDNAAVCVDATEFPGVLNPNSIYFTGDCHVTYSQTKGADMGIYNVHDRSIERFQVVSAFSRPLWIFPSFRSL